MTPARTALAAAVLAVSTAACAGPAASTPTPAACLQVTVNEWTFEPAPLRSGSAVCIELHNAGGMNHDLALRKTGTDNDAKNELFVTALVRPGGAATVHWTVPAGEYVVYCDIPGHEQAGLRTTLTVR